MNLQLQGDELNLVKSKSVIAAFISKLVLFKQNLGHGHLYHFPNLNRLRDNGEINDDDMLLYCNHMTMLHTDMCERYADILSMTLPAWILDPFSSVDGADVFLQEELIELQANDELKPKLKNRYCEFNGPVSLDDAAGDASEVTADKDSSDCNLSIELGESDSASTSSEAGASSDDAIVCNGTVLANESEMDIVEGESREADLAKFENVFKEILACTVHNDDSKKESLETFVSTLDFTCPACLSDVDIVADEEEEPSDASDGYEDEMQTDVQSEEPSFRPHTHEETLTVEPREDVMPKGSGPQRTDALETHALVFLTF
uniref:Uncharacterized protein n=1 Tax=Trichuris muris TaxID=70415 RepID=A0A5S6R590_TRIMR